MYMYYFHINTFQEQNLGHSGYHVLIYYITHLFTVCVIYSLSSQLEFKLQEGRNLCLQ